MKIAIASEGKDENSKISDRAARASFYLIFENGNLTNVLKNPFSKGGGGAGWGVAKMFLNEKIDLVISESFGENIKTALNERNIKFKEKKGIIKDFISKNETED
jgi:predicted Fe-Mo cluster-binding NifX family protein